MERHVSKADQTLIAALAVALPQAKKKTLKDRIQSGAVTINGDVVRKATHPVTVGDEVALASAGATAERSKRLPPIFADDSLYVVDKPAGMLSVAGGGEKAKTAHAVAQAESSVPLEVVHRLDRETSGVLAFAKSPADARAVMRRWKLATKTYYCVVEGTPDANEGTIDKPLWEHPTSLQVHVGQREGARDAITHFVVEKQSGGRSLLRITLETGRKHQIRVHTADMGCPIVGDDRYGTKMAREGLLLHAHELRLPHPQDDRDVVATAPIPPRLLRALR